MALTTESIDDDIFPQDNSQVVGFISNAMTLKAKGNPTFYNTLLQQLLARDDQDMLWRVYMGLSTIVTQFTNDKSNRYGDLFHALLSYDWRCSHRVSNALLYLLHHIVSSNVTYIASIFDFLIKSFVVMNQPSTNATSPGNHFMETLLL